MAAKEEEEETKSFKDLGVCDELVEACDALGWKKPFEIQIEAIPHALQGKDVIGLANTGSGKTGAFAIPIIQAWLEKPQPFFACVLAPTRELALQISEQFEDLGSASGLRCCVLVGGVKMKYQRISIAKRPHIVVATPGRLDDHLENTKGFSLGMLKYLVIDEADKLLNQEFEKSIDKILKALPSSRRTYLFSATMTEKVRKLQRMCLKNPVKIETSFKNSTVDTVEEQYCFGPLKYKKCHLVYILNKMSTSRSMIFTSRCETTKLLSLLLRELEFKVVAISGEMTQTKRLEALDMFKSGECNILVCTDVMSRGHDIKSVDLVINYDTPANYKDYIHRVGRTARAGSYGKAITLVDQFKLPVFLKIEKNLGRKLPEFPSLTKEALGRMEHVSDAKRIAQMILRKRNDKKRRKQDNDDNEDEIKMYQRKDNATVTKKYKKRKNMS